MSLERRGQVDTTIPVATGSRLSANLRHGANSAGWFTFRERVMVETLAALIVPADASGPGALEAGVVERLEAFVASTTTRQRLYRAGLKSLDKLARGKFGHSLPALGTEQQIRLLELIESGASAMRQPPTSSLVVRALRAAYFQWTGLRPASRFFRVLVKDVMALFYSSETAWAWLGYAGPPFRTQGEAY